MKKDDVPDWVLSLELEEIEFVKKFIVSSGSLKELAKHYDVSYPTVRIRVDRIIQKIEVNEKIENEPFIAYIKQMAIEDRITIEDAKKSSKNIDLRGATINEFFRFCSNYQHLFGNTVFLIESSQSVSWCHHANYFSDRDDVALL